MIVYINMVYEIVVTVKVMTYQFQELCYFDLYPFSFI